MCALVFVGDIIEQSSQRSPFEMAYKIRIENEESTLPWNLPEKEKKEYEKSAMKKQSSGL